MTQTYIDPVCGVIITHRTAFAQSNYRGKIYYFCSKADKETFDKHPVRYIFALHQPILLK
jgi:YHS domain-containing protein